MGGQEDLGGGAWGQSMLMLPSHTISLSHTLTLAQSLPPTLCVISATPLERALKRLEWDRVRAKEMQDAADEAEKERMATQAIDW